MKHTLYLSILGLLCMICFACERPEVDNTDNNYPIELSVTTGDGHAKLSWTTTNVSTFENYIILRSTDSISDDVANFFFAGNVIANISEVEESSFVDEDVPFTDHIYYKVLVEIGSRVLLSPTVRIDLELTILDFKYSQFHFEPDDQIGYFYDPNFGVMYQYDFVNNIFPGSPITPSSIPSKLYSGSYGGGEMYILDRTSTLSIYSQAPFQYQASLVSAGSTYDDIYSVAYQNGLIFITIDNWNTPLRIYDRVSKNLVASHTYTNTSSEHLIVPLPEGENKFMIASQRNLEYYDFDGDGNVTTHTEFPIASYNLLEKPQISPDGQYIVPYENGMVFQTSPTQQTGTLVSPGASWFSSIVFSEEGNRLFAVPNNPPARIEEYSLPDLKLVKSHQMPFGVGDICAAANKVYAIGAVFFNSKIVTAVETITIE